MHAGDGLHPLLVPFMLRNPRRYFLALLIFAGCSAFVGCNAAAEKEAYRKVRDAGGKLSFDGDGLDVDFSNRTVTNEQLATLQVLPSIHSLRIVNVPLNDSAVDVLLAIKQIENLSIKNSRISEEGLQRLRARYPNLTSH